MKKILLIALLSICQFAFSQNKGIVTGTVTDKEMSGEPLPFANVFIKGTSIGGTTDMDGKYTISVPAGNHTIVFSFVGYETIEKTITIIAGQTLTLNQEVGASQGVALDEVQINASVNKEKESALLLEQKKAVSIKTSIGAQELSRKGVSDVATAVTKTTGISKQEGTGSVFVRGLGDRYNVTTLNGLPLPSNDPSKKNIDLGIFSTDIVEFIGIDKTYDVQNYGDFSGANIDISSKNYKGKGFIEIGLGLGGNTEAISVDNFYLNDGPNTSGFYNTNYPAFPLNNYNFVTSWDREESNPPFYNSMSLKGGDSFQLGKDTRLNIFAVGSFDNNFKYKEGVSRGSVNVSGVARRDYNFNSYAYNTNTTTMGNLQLKHKQHTFKYNGLFINTSSQKQDEYNGTVDAFDYAPNGGAFVQRATFDRTKLFIHQLLGDHKFGKQFEVNWGGSYNFVDNDTPNRRQVIVTPDDWNQPDGPKSFQLTNNDSDNHRFYQELEEEELATNISTTFKFNPNEDEEYMSKIKMGYSGRFKTVDFKSTQFNFRINRSGSTVQPIIDDVYDLDSYFNQENFNAGLFSIRTFRGGLGTTGVNVLFPQTFGGKQDINAAFISFEHKFSSKFTAILGVRGEKITQTLSFNTSLSSGNSDLDEFEILPMLTMKYILNEDQNLKLAVSKTYTLPQYKERAQFQFEEVTQSFIGNPALYLSTDYNFDLKWDYFPTRNEIISLGVFGKYIQDPINDVTINSASNDVSWVNSGEKATAFGVEFEMRKNIFEKEKDDSFGSNLDAGLNISYMYSNQDLDGNKVIQETDAAGFPLSVDFTENESRLSGASDLLLNADVSYMKNFRNDKNIQGTLAFNYFSDRIFALGTEGKGNLIDSSVGTLDFILKTKLNKNLGLGLSAKNLLNPTIERKQELQNVIVSSYKAGVDLKLSLSYNF
ncbi:outer membrane receptor protein involved in Fe transport [Tenacibaculum adriaticum]|uniref:Outer membrane receptor protein involved in Fe transport n=1 Tax=Tenacibaculum adriaticum TaxID=413713 RepID=A0A5S5DUM6_9FLAO|nr:TonB-dependent receptor [Tenacibaculum adriaticum]TYP99643.1 outer membrane receptor protein involved in Fe transport [Tenacibaculum adriaticum]